MPFRRTHRHFPSQQECAEQSLHVVVGGGVQVRTHYRCGGLVSRRAASAACRTLCKLVPVERPLLVAALAAAGAPSSKLPHHPDLFVRRPPPLPLLLLLQCQRSEAAPHS